MAADLRSKLCEANLTRLDQIMAVDLETIGGISVLDGNPDAPRVDLEMLRGVRESSGSGDGRTFRQTGRAQSAILGGNHRQVGREFIWHVV